MRHVRQKNETDCGIAVAAMLAGASYESAMRAAASAMRDIGLYSGALVSVLRGMTGQRWRSLVVSAEQIDSSIIPAADCALLIKLAGERDNRGHWIASRAGKIYDPELPSPFPIEHYPRRRRHLVRIITHSSP